jgi:phage tail tape-measure protein
VLGIGDTLGDGDGTTDGLGLGVGLGIGLGNALGSELGSALGSTLGNALGSGDGCKYESKPIKSKDSLGQTIYPVVSSGLPIPIKETRRFVSVVVKTSELSHKNS